MATESARLRMPYIAAAQAQKHVTHNEAITLLDTLVQLSVADKDLGTPPAEPEEGDSYIVAGVSGGGTAAGAWEGWETRVVRFIDGIWRSYLPGAGDGKGWLAYVQDEDTIYVFTGTAWEPLFVAEGHSGVSSINGQAGDVVLDLDDLDNVDAAAPDDGEVLAWNAMAGAWVPAESAGGGEPGPPGEPGLDGARWHSGAADPDNELGEDGDFYLQTGTGAAGVLGDVWAKVSGAWSILANIRGASGAGTGDVIGPDGGVSDGHALLFDGASGKLTRSAGFVPANVSHGHVVGDVDGLEAALEGKVTSAHIGGIVLLENQDAYDALDPPDPNLLYLVPEEEDE